MSHTQTHERELTLGSETRKTYRKAVTDGVESNLSHAVPDGSTDLLLLWTADISQLKALFIGSDQDITIETNNPGGASAAPDDTLALKANQPIDWLENDVMSHPLTADVTQIYVTNASGSTANLECCALMDESL